MDRGASSLTIPRTLPDIVEAIDRSTEPLVHYSTGIRSDLDQLAARAADELQQEADIDLSDPQTARVAATVGLYILERARRRSGVPIPSTLADYIHSLAGAYDAINGITSAVAQKHREAAAS